MKKCLKFFSTILTFILLIINCTSCSINTNAWNEHNEKKYLSNNNAVIDLSNSSDFSSFKMIDPSLNNHDIFLTGEDHGVKLNTTLEFEFLKYFTQKAGVKYYLLELGHSYAILYNKYLQTGDESLLKIASDSAIGTMAWTKEQDEKWKKIYEYNLTLPENQKITVIGPDLEFNSGSFFWSLNYLLPKGESPKVIKNIINHLKSYNKVKSINKFGYKDFCEKLNESIKTNHKVYEEYLGDSLFDFEFISDNVIKGFEAKNTATYIDFINYRDSKIYENFLALTARIPKGKFYGQFGLNHNFLKSQNNVKWFASYLNSQNSQYYNRVLSIEYIYKYCKFINNMENYKVDNLISYNESDKTFTSSATNDITLFKLTGDASPYNKKLLWYLSNPDVPVPKSGVTTDYFQFIVFIKNSDAAKAYGNDDNR